MRQSESIKNLSKALLAAQSEIGGSVKGSSNPFFKSQYADLNSVIKELKPVYARHDLTVIQLPVSDACGVGVSTRLLHESGEWLEDQFTLPLAKNDPQAAGSCITYAKRYALKALGLMPDLDDDAEGAMFRAEKQIEETKQMIEAGVQLNACLEVDDYHGAAQIYDEWTHEENSIIARAPSKGGQLTDRKSVV